METSAPTGVSAVLFVSELSAEWAQPYPHLVLFVLVCPRRLSFRSHQVSINDVKEIGGGDTDLEWVEEVL